MLSVLLTKTFVMNDPVIIRTHFNHLLIERLGMYSGQLTLYSNIQNQIPLVTPRCFSARIRSRPSLSLFIPQKNDLLVTYLIVFLSESLKNTVRPHRESHPQIKEVGWSGLIDSSRPFVHRMRPSSTSYMTKCRVIEAN